MNLAPEGSRRPSLKSLRDDPASRIRPVRVFFAALILAVGIGILVLGANSGKRKITDFISYWSAGQQLVHHGNPYDRAGVFALERSVGFTASHPAFMRNMPSDLFIAYPLGFVGERTGLILWFVLTLAALMVSVRLLWIAHGRRADGINLAAYCFPPIMACLITGQVGIFLLFGIVLFFHFHRDRPSIAGFGLLLCTLKPHIFVPFGIVFLLWSITRRSYRVIGTVSIMFAAGAALSCYLDPHVWTHYWQMMKGENLANEFIPTVSIFFRLAIDRQVFALQFLPVALASVWAIWYFLRNRDRWEWRTHGLLLLVVSVMVAPYAWFTDEAVLLPVIISGLYAISDSRRSMLPYLCIAGIAFLEVLAGIEMTSGFYVWTTTAWLLWYLWTLKKPLQRTTLETVC